MCYIIKNAPVYVRSGQDSLDLEQVEEPEPLEETEPVEEPEPVERPLPLHGFNRTDGHDYMR